MMPQTDKRIEQPISTIRLRAKGKQWMMSSSMHFSHRSPEINYTPRVGDYPGRCKRHGQTHGIPGDIALSNIFARALQPADLGRRGVASEHSS